MDVFGLGAAFKAPGAKRNVLAAATTGVVVITALDVLVAWEATRARR